MQAKKRHFKPDSFREIALRGIPDMEPQSYAWEKWWDKVRWRCMHGMKYNDVQITGKYYFHLNFGWIKHQNKMIRPWFRWDDKEYFDTFERARKEGKGIIELKAREKGFEQPVSEPVLTDKGWKKMGDIEIGSKVCTDKGTYAEVIRTFPQGVKDVYEIELLDGRKVRCGENHLWKVVDKARKKKEKILSVKELLNIGIHYYTNDEKNIAYRFALPEIEAVPFEEKKLPVHPYLLGILLGDGTINKQLKISSVDAEILSFISNELGIEYELVKDNYSVCNYRIVYKKNRKRWDKSNPLKEKIKELNLLKKCHDKFIPDIYKHSSIEQRLEIIRGLMDTDGHISPDGGMEIQLCSRQLSYDIVYILRSLGIQCRINEFPGRKNYRNIFRIYIRTIKYNLFRLKRKSDRFNNKKDIYRNYPIKNISKLSYKEESKCIMIKDKDHIYLTADFVPTHNSYNTDSIIAHEYTFEPYSESAVAAGLQSTANDEMSKIDQYLNLIHEGLRHRRLQSNNYVIESGIEEKENDAWVKKGYRSKILCRTMDNPGVWRGGRFRIMYFAEAGEFENLLESYTSSIACFRSGEVQFGIPVIGGTGGDIKKSAKDFREMYYNADTYNLIKIFVPASHVYFPCYGWPGALKKDIPNIWEDQDKEGKSDVQEAERRILDERAEKAKNDDKRAFYSHTTEFCLTEKEAFRISGHNNFDADKLNAQIINIMENKLQVRPYGLRWETDKEGKKTGKVIAEPDENGKIFLKTVQPLSNMKGLYIGGCDSYDQAKAKTTTSKGAIVIYQRFVNMNIPGDYPVAVYSDRPATPEQFYENALKLCVFFNSMVLVEYTKYRIMDYFMQSGYMHLLKERPRTADAPNTKTTNRFGVPMYEHQKILAEELLQEYINKSSQDIWFIQILEDLLEYGSRNTDIAMAFGITLLHNNDNFKMKIKEDHLEEDPFTHVPVLKIQNGVPVYTGGMTGN